MRWFLYLGCFLAIIVGSFWVYLWSYRVEFLQTALERSCPAYRFAIGAIKIQNSTSVIIQNISVLSKEEPSSRLFYFTKVELSSPTSEWLFWLFTPSPSPLHLKTVTLTASEMPPFSSLPAFLCFPIAIDTCTLIAPDKTTINPVITVHD